MKKKMFITAVAFIAVLAVVAVYLFRPNGSEAENHVDVHIDGTSMQKPKDWENVKATVERVALPVGAYICKIVGAKVVDYKDKQDESKILFSRLEIALDICEGEYAGHYQTDFDQCEDCRNVGRVTVATEVHHIEPIRTAAGWERRLDQSNLVVLCPACHNKRHKRFGSRPRGDIKKV